MIKFNSKTTMLALIFIMLALPVTASAATLSYWYSDSSSIGKWSSTPEAYYSKIDTSASFSFASGLQNGETVWNDALGTSVDFLPHSTTKDINYYGGTKAQLDALSIFNPVPTGNLGLTSYTSRTDSGTHTYNGTSKTWYTHKKINGYVVSRTDMTYDNYLHTATHEVGHGMGWHGHPSTSQSTWVMQQGKLENTSLSTNEKRHLSQIY